MYENKTEYLILNNMLDKVETPVAKIEGSLVYDALSPVACELSKHYMELDAFIKRAFVQTSHSTFLDLRGVEYGLYRKQPTKAIVDLVFTGETGVIIPEGFLVQTIDGKQFRTTQAAAVANGTATVTATAVNTGNAANVTANSIVLMPSVIDGVTGVTNPAKSAGGTAVESDDDFRNRILDKVRNPGSSGNINHYVQWAMEVDGVGAVRVFPLWNGGGTVRVAILDSNRLPATQTIVDAVKTHIEAERPVGAAVTVESGVIFPVDIVVDVELDGTQPLETVRAGVETAVRDFFKRIAFKQNTVSYPKLSAVILAVDGVADHTALTINGVAGNVTIPDTGVATLNEIFIG